MTEKKLTKKNYFEALAAVVDQMEDVNGIPAQEVADFIAKQIDQIDAKASKAKAKAAEKKAEGDELREVVLSVVTDQFQTADAITEQVEGEDVTKAKVVARLTSLINAGLVVKDKTKVDKAEKVVYKLA